jgi:hypothetical protein
MTDSVEQERIAKEYVTEAVRWFLQEQTRNRPPEEWLSLAENTLARLIFEAQGVALAKILASK